MKNKAILYISIFLVILLLLYFLFKKHFYIPKENICDVLNDIKNKYGFEIAKNVEKIYRLETNNFTSEQYKDCGSAGMLAFTNNYPYGWNNLSIFWSLKNKYKPTGIGYEFTDVEGVNYKYLKFDNFGGFYTLAEFLKQHDNNPGRWNSTDVEKQNTYNNAIALIKNEYII